MANAVPSRLGQVNLAGDAKALFLKVFGGEVLTAFMEATAFMSRHMVRTITSGKSASFPATGKGSASYHTPGAELVGSTVAANEKIIVVDDLLVADRFVAEIEEAMNHYDIRSIYSRDIGMALARTFDKNVAQVMVKAARASATVTGGNGGTVIDSANSKTDAQALVDAIFDAIQALDEKDVPTADRYIFLQPAQYYLLVNSSIKAINRDYNADTNGGPASGQIFRIGGVPIVKTYNLPSTEITTGPTAYQGDFTTTSALVSHRDAAGTVKLIDVAVSSDWDPRRLGTLLVGKMAVGSDVLRPECAVEIRTGAPA